MFEFVVLIKRLFKAYVRLHSTNQSVQTVQMQASSSTEILNQPCK